MGREHLRELLEDFTLEEIIENSNVEVIDALEYMVTYGILNLDWSNGDKPE